MMRTLDAVAFDDGIGLGRTQPQRHLLMPTLLVGEPVDHRPLVDAETPEIRLPVQRRRQQGGYELRPIPTVRAPGLEVHLGDVPMIVDAIPASVEIPAIGRLGEFDAHTRTGVPFLQLPDLERVIGEEKILDRMALLPHPPLDMRIGALSDPLLVPVAQLAPMGGRNHTITEAARRCVGTLAPRPVRGGSRGGRGSHRTIVPDRRVGLQLSDSSASCPSPPVRSVDPPATDASGSGPGSRL